MSALHKRIFVATSLACLLLATIGIAVPGAAARNLTYHLFGSRTAGWGFSNTSLTTPGPLIQVEVGDNVTLNLTSVDGRMHRWFIDYNNNSVADATEPASNNFGVGIDWNFTVSNQTGTFVYRSDRTAGPGDDLAAMWGNLTVRPAGSTPGTFEANALLIGGAVVLFVVVLAVAALYRRRTKPPVPPPPPEE